MATTILIKRDTSTNWSNNNPILKSGEFGLETDTRKIKIGNGQRWNSILKFIQPTENTMEALLVNYILNSEKGQANGLATLDSYGKIPLNQLPDALSLDSELSAAAVLSSADATSKANAAQAAAEATASADATSKANAAQAAAEATASADATSKANAAQAAAEGYADNLSSDILNNIGNSLGDYIPLNQFGTPSGVATLNVDGILSISQIPDSLATKVYADNAAATAVAAAIDSAPATLNTLNELAAAINDDSSFATTVTTAIGTKAPIDSPTFTGTVSGITSSMVGLGNVNNTSDSSKPISTATQTVLDTKLNKIIETNPQPGSYSIISSDAFKLIEMSGGGTLTIVDSINFPIGTTIEVLQTTDSQVLIAGSGFTPNSTPGLKLRAKWSSATLLKRGTNSWVVMGDLSA